MMFKINDNNIMYDYSNPLEQIVNKLHYPYECITIPVLTIVANIINKSKNKGIKYLLSLDIFDELKGVIKYDKSVCLKLKLY